MQMIHCARRLITHTILKTLLLLVAMQALARPLSEVKSSGTLKVGFEPGFLPFELRLPDGSWVGFDVDMMQAFAKDLGVQVEFLDTKWDGIIPSLMAGKFDLIVSGMTITPERAQVVLFSEPYYKAGLKLLLKPDLASSIKTLSDFDKKTFRLAVKQGTTGDIFASKEFKHVQIIKLESESDAANSVILGKADGFLYDKPFVDLFTVLHKDKVLALPETLSNEVFGVAARPKDRDLIEAFNKFLAKWKATGGYDATIKRHFEEMPWKNKIEKMW